MDNLISRRFRRCAPPRTAPAQDNVYVRFWPILLLGVIFLTACETTSSSRQVDPPTVPAPQRVIEGALGVRFDMGKDDLTALGFVERKVLRRVADVGIWTKGGIAGIGGRADPFWEQLQVRRSPTSGQIIWIEGSKFYSRTTHLDTGRECSAALQQLMGALRERYPTLEQYTGLIHGREGTERWIFTERRIRSQLMGFTDHRDARSISLTCASQVFGEDNRIIGHLLTIDYSVSSAERKRVEDEFKAEFDARSSDQLRRQGLDPSGL